MQIHLHEVKILQIHNARPAFVKKKIPRLLTIQNPAFLYKGLLFKLKQSGISGNLLNWL